MSGNAVVLAAGRGTRMRERVPGLRLTAEQERLADAGLKALIPFRGEPFLAYVLTSLVDAGWDEIRLVVRPGLDDPVRAAFERRPTRRCRIGFAVQDEPLGSAHALLQAEAFAGDEPFVMINADNHYPVEVLAAMHALAGSGMPGFSLDTLVAASNIPAERVSAYALVATDARGCLSEIVEKPSAADAGRLRGRSWISMNCWRFGPSIFEAARRVAPSPRGELELQAAVRIAAREAGECFRVVPTTAGVLDLSRREDILTISPFIEALRVDL